MNTIDIEIVLKNHNSIPKCEIIQMCNLYLQKKTLKAGTIFTHFSNTDNVIIFDGVEKIIIDSNTHAELDLTQLHVNWYVYTLDKNGPQSDNCEDDSGEQINLSTQWILPSYDMSNMWENLVYDNNIKENLLKYASTMMEFADRGVDNNIIACNRVILLHGPPGTGKTSLCKALAHKLSIKLQKRCSQSILIEINSHSLFSKWFSESGKLVTKMFTKIKEIIEDSNMLVCVLIDEIESLAHARDQCMSGNEPSDSIRVVNAVLTQIDQMRRYSNVIILATSNMTGAIDIAFIDRADIKQYLGLPSVKAVYKIYHSCIEELLNTGIVQTKLTLPDVHLKIDNCVSEDSTVSAVTKNIIDISYLSVGLSGRTLRKIPFLAHALFLNRSVTSLEEFLEAMKKAVIHELQQKTFFNQD